MTNKQTIDGVSRETIQRIADHCKFWIDHPYLEAIADVEEELRALLDKPESLDLEEPHVVGYMPDHPDGDPLITLEDHQNYVAALFARQASALKADPVGCRYRKTDRPDRCWTYCEGVKVSPWKGWEVQPLFTELPAAQPQGEVEPMAYLCRNVRHPIPSLRTQWEPITVAYAQARMHNKALAEKGKADEYHLGDEFQPLFTEQPSHSGDSNEMVAKVVLPESYSLAMFQMISGFESVTPEQFDLVWSACRAEVAKLNGMACTSCDGSGEYTDAIGCWRGYCSCPAGIEAKGLKGDHS